LGAPDPYDVATSGKFCKPAGDEARTIPPAQRAPGPAARSANASPARDPPAGVGC